MKKYTFALAVSAFFLGVPFLSLAQSAGDKDSVQGYILLIGEFIGNTLIPLLFAVALLLFLVNAARYFILDGDDSDGQEKAKTLALYGIGAFVFLISIWGIVNMFVEGLEIDDTAARCPDYLGRWCTTKDAYSGQFNNTQFYTDEFENYYGDLGSQQGKNRQVFEITNSNGDTVSKVPVTPTQYDSNGNIIYEQYTDEQETKKTNIRLVPEDEDSEEGNIRRTLTEEDVIRIGNTVDR